MIKHIKIILAVSSAILLSSCGNTKQATNTTSETTQVSESEATVVESTTLEETTTEDIPVEVISLIAGKPNDYSEKIVFNEGTEFEESKIVYFLPQGKYSAKNVSSNMAQINVYSREKNVVDGWEEPAETVLAKLLKENEDVTFEITGDQYIDIQRPDKFDISVIEYYEDVETTSESDTEAETSATEAVKESAWTTKHFVDDFDRETDNLYISSYGSGTFSNSATTRSPLKAEITAFSDFTPDGDKAMVYSIYLWEYESNLVTNYYSTSNFYTIKVLEENDNVLDLVGNMSSQNDLIYVFDMEDMTSSSITNAFKNNSKLTFKIELEDGMDSYLFDIDCTGFSDALADIWDE